jgi:hypothetical protein
MRGLTWFLFEEKEGSKVVFMPIEDPAASKMPFENSESFRRNRTRQGSAR